MNRNSFIKFISGVILGIPWIAKAAAQNTAPGLNATLGTPSASFSIYREVTPCRGINGRADFSLGSEVYATIDIGQEEQRVPLSVFVKKPDYIRVNGVWMQPVKNVGLCMTLDDIYERCHSGRPRSERRCVIP